MITIPPPSILTQNRDSSGGDFFVLFFFIAIYKLTILFEPIFQPANFGSEETSMVDLRSLEQYCE